MTDKLCPTCQRANDADARSCWMCGCAFPSAEPAPQRPAGSIATQLAQTAARLAEAAAEAARRQLKSP